MTYPQDFEAKISFPLIREQVEAQCSSAMGREKVEELTFLTDFTTLTTLLQQAHEMLTVLQDASLDYPKAELHDLRESLRRIRIEGLFMDEEELMRLRKTLAAAEQYIRFFQSLPEQRFPLLNRFAAPTTDTLNGFSVSQTLASIDRLIDKYGRLRDNASPEMARIRQALQQAQGSVSRVLHTILRRAQAEGMVEPDVMPTLREGRLVIPVSPAYKRKIGGIVHDESATGKTVYIEPNEAVEANNRIRELESEERRERARILLQITADIRPSLPAIHALHAFLAEADFLHAKAAFALQTGALVPQLTEKPLIDWREARHPLLEQRLRKQNKPIVPLTISLHQKQRILVISGPNAGGKSVCLKTVALLQYMLQCGLPIPVREDSQAGMFQHLFIDIGDEQSIEDDLSTYSSHLRNMKYFLRHSQQQTLVLIDEAGGGTEPRIGGAIAEAVLRQLNEQQAFGIITTHFDNLKHFAEDTAGIVNGAMLYDRHLLQPLFQLSVGQAGSSFAIEIARQIGLPESIVSEAEQLAGAEHINYERHLQDIQRDKHYWEKKRAEVHQQEKHLKERIAYYEEQIGGAKQQRRDILEKARQQAEELLRESNAVIENTIRQIKEAKAEKQPTQEARQELENFRRRNQQRRPEQPRRHSKPEAAAPALPAAELRIGARVRKKNTDLIGEVLELTDKQALVTFGSIRSYIPLKQIEVVSARQMREQRQQTRVVVQSNVTASIHNRQLAFRQELDLRGMRVDEALTALESYIDDAVMVGAEEVRILHGTGTGALRQVVRDYLQMQRRVHSFHDAHPDQGGAGITVVSF